MLAPVIAAQLRDRGHDVVAIRGSEHEGLDHDAVMELARSSRRAIVTNNVGDFRRLHHEAITPGGPGDFGMVFVPGGYRRTRADTGRLVEALEQKLREFPGDEDLAGGETWL
jgi:hypothetical protein